MREVCYTLLNTGSKRMSEYAIKQNLEFGDSRVQANALMEVIEATAAGQSCPCESYLMLIIRFVLPEPDHTLKKLLMMLWEVYPMTSADGTLIKEMILVCDSMRRDLEHPNEYVRGATLRFLCKLKQPEILEPLVNCVRANLNHRRPYVRRNAILAVYSIHKSYNYLIPDAPELIQQLVQSEKEAACKRNAFICLLNMDMDKAVNYLLSSLDQVPKFDHSLQIVVVELIQKICQRNSHEKSGFMRCVYTLLDSKSQAVRYEAAKALTMLTGAPTAVKASICCYVDIIVKAVDLTTRLIVLDRLVDMKGQSVHRRILQENISHMLSLVPRNKDLKIKSKVIHLITDLISENNIQQVIDVLKKECSKEDTLTEYLDYRILLTNKLHHCYCKYPWTASQVVKFFDDLLANQADEKLLLIILTLLREAAQKFESIRQTITEMLKRRLDNTDSAQVYCRSLWIIVEFTHDPYHLVDVIEQLFQTIQGIHEYLQLSKQGKHSDQGQVSKYTSKINNHSLVLNDKLQDNIGFKAVIKLLTEDIVKNTGFLVTTISWSATKAFLRLWNFFKDNVLEMNKISNKTMYIIATTLHLNRLNNNLDSCSRLENCLHLVNSPNEEVLNRLSVECRQALFRMLSKMQANDQEDKAANKGGDMLQVDESVSLLHSSTDALVMVAVDDDPLEDVAQDEAIQESRLDRVIQLTGLSDPVYCEARLLHDGQHHISLHLTLLNRTVETLFNCSVQLAASGDLAIIDKPPTKTVAPQETVQMRINITISLTGNSLIYGNIVYDTAKATEPIIVILQDIPVNVVDYMKPADCGQDDFRRMWLEFEWENKVLLTPKNTTDLDRYANLIATTLNMKCLTGTESSADDCPFLTANLHGLSVFGDRIIANLSLERRETKITGHIRLRARSQGIVLGIGDVLSYIKC